MGPLGNWNLWVNGTLEQLGQNRKNPKKSLNYSVTSDINESAIRICTGCENDLLASYYWIECSENICDLMHIKK